MAIFNLNNYTIGTTITANPGDTFEYVQSYINMLTVCILTVNDTATSSQITEALTTPGQVSYVFGSTGHYSFEPTIDNAGTSYWIIHIGSPTGN
ncbi:MAG: hypothetical protein ACYCOU_12730 [Sulfobacillus sp.]